MAIRLVKGTNEKNTELSCDFGNESLTFVSNVSYDFPHDTSSSVQYNGKIFKPIRLFLTPKFHKGDHTFELVIQHEDGDNEHVFFCFPLIKSASPDAIVFPMTVSPLPNMLPYASEPTHYKTKGNHHIFVWSHITEVSEQTFPIILGDPLKRYKEIIEPDTYESQSSLVTNNDRNKNRVIQGEGVHAYFKKNESMKKEGFAARKETELTCQMYVDNKAVKTDFALAPLHSGAYERGLIFFNISIVVLLVGGFGFFLFPFLFEYLMTVCSIIDFSTKRFWLWVILWLSGILGFLLILLGCLLITGGKKNKIRMNLVTAGYIIFLTTFFSMSSICIKEGGYWTGKDPTSITVTH